MALRLVQITDPHLLNPGEQLMGLEVEKRLRAVLKDAERHEPDGYCITGDFCAHDPRPEVYARLRPILDDLGKPTLLIAGNHDDRSMMRDAFVLAGTGGEPIYGATTIADNTLLYLDSSEGRVGEQQLDWLEKALHDYPDAPLFMHHPPLEMGVQFMDRKYPLRDTDRLLQLLGADGHRRRVFCGHYHTSRMVSRGSLDVFLCPPSSFFIRPAAEDFELEPHYPGYLLLEWSDAGDFRCSEMQVHHAENPAV